MYQICNFRLNIHWAVELESLDDAKELVDKYNNIIIENGDQEKLGKFEYYMIIPTNKDIADKCIQDAIEARKKYLAS